MVRATARRDASLVAPRERRPALSTGDSVRHQHARRGSRHRGSSRAASSPCASPATGASGGSCSTTRRSSKIGLMGVEVRPCRDLEELGDGARRRSSTTSAGAPTRGAARATLRPVLLPERMHAAFDDGEAVGGAGVFPFQLTVPGGRVPAAGVTTRRRCCRRTGGAGSSARSCAPSSTTCTSAASRSPTSGPRRTTIYGRFGYGLASLAGELTIPRAAHAGSRDRVETHGRIRLVAPDEALEIVPADLRARRRRHARHVRAHARLVGDPRARRSRGAAAAAASSARALLEIDGEPEGYALYRLNPSFEHGVVDRHDERDRGDRRDVPARRRDLALPARHRLDGPRAGVAAARRSSARAAARRAAPRALDARRRALGSARRRRRRAVRSRVRRGTVRSCSTCATRSARGTRAVGASPRRAPSARTTTRTSVSTSRRSASVYLGGFSFAGARPGRTRRGARAGRDRVARRALPHRPCTVVPRDLLMPVDPTQLARLSVLQGFPTRSCDRSPTPPTRSRSRAVTRSAWRATSPSISS